MKNRGAVVAGIRYRRIYHGEATAARQTVLNDGGETKLLLLLLLDGDRAAAEEERKEWRGGSAANRESISQPAFIQPVHQ